LFAVWAAFHPPLYAARFDLTHPSRSTTSAGRWQAAPFARYMLNTFILVTMTLAGQLVLCTLAAYAFARLEFRGREVLFFLVLVQLMITPDVLLVENYRTVSRLGILDTILAIGLPYMASAFGIFLLRQTFKTVPKELDDAARIEGCSPLGHPLAGLRAAGAADVRGLWPGLGELSLEQLPLAPDRHELGRDAAADRGPLRSSPRSTRASTGR
jgi:ABC-type glycerol-3-phosphate transport system permease component